MKSRDEIMMLKESWSSDPCWDLCETEGFEEYHDELKEFEETMNKEWQQKADYILEEQNKAADSLGIRGLYQKYLELESNLDYVENDIYNMLKNINNDMHNKFKDIENELYFIQKNLD